MPAKSVQTAREMPADDPRHAARATRSAGRQMRSRLLDGASRLFRECGLAGVSISDIAAAADAFPSQITGFASRLDALLQTAGLNNASWKQVPKQQCIDEQTALWARIETTR